KPALLSGRKPDVQNCRLTFLRKESVDDDGEHDTDGGGTDDSSAAGCHRPGPAWVVASQRASGAGGAGGGAGARAGGGTASRWRRCRNRELPRTGRCGAALAGRVADVSDRGARVLDGLQAAVGRGPHGGNCGDRGARAAFRDARVVPPGWVSR